MLRGVRRLETESYPCCGRGGGDLVQPGDDDRAGALVDRRSGEDDDGLRLVLREPVHARAQGGDPVGRVGRAFHAGDAKRQDRRDHGDAVGDPEAGLSEACDVRVVVWRQLHLPDADAVEAGGRVRGDVLLEGRVHGRDLGERELHPRASGSFERTRRGSGARVSSL